MDIDFATSTVLTIAHRIHTIVEYDLVIELNEGRLVEFNAPHVLI